MLQAESIGPALGAARSRFRQSVDQILDLPDLDGRGDYLARHDGAHHIAENLGRRLFQIAYRLFRVGVAAVEFEDEVAIGGVVQDRLVQIVRLYPATERAAQHFCCVEDCEVAEFQFDADQPLVGVGPDRQGVGLGGTGVGRHGITVCVGPCACATIAS
ncbi:hypothetical protein [Breoghania sp.]|uniref:hypothetical protein n=1 Tax=Breoghania sp. TaxID=2065378 RepID=UPI00262FC75A|nr:hypothetical protein [Breoghania sp.]